MKSREQLLHEIGVVSFIVVELGLFLDTHPGDNSAQEHLKYYNRMLKQMKAEFANQYYPLCMESAENKEYGWNKAPLPWEGGCA